MEKFIITELKSDAILAVVDRNVATFTTFPARDNALSASSKPGQIIAKFAYILLPQIKHDCFDISKSFLWPLKAFYRHIRYMILVRTMTDKAAV